MLDTVSLHDKYKYIRGRPYVLALRGCQTGLDRELAVTCRYLIGHLSESSAVTLARIGLTRRLSEKMRRLLGKFYYVLIDNWKVEVQRCPLLLHAHR